MNRSYSKIRHIQESNILLEQRRLNQIINEEYREIEELDEWIESNNDYISPDSLREKVEELFNLRGDVDVEETVEEDSGGDEYGENWSKRLITITHNGDALVKIWVKSDYRYDYGKNSSEFGKRFYFNQYSL